MLLWWYIEPKGGKIRHMALYNGFESSREIGESEVYLEFQQRVARVAKVDRPVLLIGERGTGKELAARRLHYMSSRWQGPLVTINCASLPPSLIEYTIDWHTHWHLL